LANPRREKHEKGKKKVVFLTKRKKLRSLPHSMGDVASRSSLRGGGEGGLRHVGKKAVIIQTPAARKAKEESLKQEKRRKKAQSRKKNRVTAQLHDPTKKRACRIMETRPKCTGTKCRQTLQEKKKEDRGK